MLQIIVSFLLSLNMSQAHDGHELKSHHEYRSVHELVIQGGVAHLVVHEGGHIAGQPFQVEFRVQCEGDERPLFELPVVSSYSACDLDPDSFKVNRQRTAIAFKMKHANLNRYYDELAEGAQAPKIHCAQATSIKKFSLRGLCSPAPQ